MHNKVYVLDTAELDDETLFDRWLGKMTSRRRQKIAAFRFDKDKRLCLGAGIYKDDVDAESFKSKAKASFKSGVDASGDSVSVTGVSYVALIEPELRFYVSQTNEVWAASTEISIDNPDLTAKMIKTKNGFCVRVTGLKADDFGKIFTLTIGTTEITYNGYAYLYTVLREESTAQETLKDLSKGVYRYAAAAEATFV